MLGRHVKDSRGDVQCYVNSYCNYGWLVVVNEDDVGDSYHNVCHVIEQGSGIASHVDNGCRPLAANQGGLVMASEGNMSGSY